MEENKDLEQNQEEINEAAENVSEENPYKEYEDKIEDRLVERKREQKIQKAKKKQK